MRLWEPTASVTGRPLRWSSSASCTPVAEAPTTSTPPSGRSSGLRYSLGTTWWTWGESRRAAAGIAGRSHQPVATTMFWAWRLPLSVIDGKAVSVAGDTVDGGVLEHGCVERSGVPREEVGDLDGRHEAIGVTPGVGVAGQPGHPVRGEQAKRVPAFAVPAFGDPATLDHEVVVVAVGEAAAEREAGLATADDEGVGRVHGGPSIGDGGRARAGHPVPSGRAAVRIAGQPTSTSIATGTPLVMTS